MLQDYAIILADTYLREDTWEQSWLVFNPQTAPQKRSGLHSCFDYTCLPVEEIRRALEGKQTGLRSLVSMFRFHLRAYISQTGMGHV